MKRSIQEIVELLVFGLIAVLIGTGLLWVVGWAIGGLGALFKLFAALIWSLLRFIVPIAVVGAAVYALVRLLQGPRRESPAAATTARKDTASQVDVSASRPETPEAPAANAAGSPPAGTAPAGSVTPSRAPDAPPPPADPEAPAQHTRPAAAPDASTLDPSSVEPAPQPAADVTAAERDDDDVAPPRKRPDASYGAGSADHEDDEMDDEDAGERR